ncbi:MAG: response regulator transcription factor [Deferribacteres bacterium]|nr:response regulator transcription factor [candidate division KSB1 bacterium]MCB9511823.1 response regulator transcription factor [Deferribacteres bacterium]
MQQLKILIVDDEPPARKKLRTFLKNRPEVSAVLEAGDGIAAVASIEQDKPDLIFLDIQMPGMTGLEVIEAVGSEAMPAVVFVTAYDQYAIEAFDVQAVDYLLKPYDAARFEMSFRRAVERLASRRESIAAILQAFDHLQQHGKNLERILVNSGQRYFFIKTAEIAYISAEEKYVQLHTVDKKYLIRETMTRLEQRLDPAQFVRIHRSFFVNLDSIREMQPWSHGDYILILKNGEKLTVSRRYRERLWGSVSGSKRF